MHPSTLLHFAYVSEPFIKIDLSLCNLVHVSFKVVGEIEDVVKTGLWVGDCFIYTNSGECHYIAMYYI